ncbi:MAG: response regulator [Myxococcota bacterium]|nr:response regulator [Myxococcota bacterium]
MRAREHAEPPEAGAQDSSILVVDDEPANLLAVEAALGDMGHRLVKVESGEAALKELLGGHFALIILDVHMPGLDGFETARLVRQRPRTRHVPIIFATAYDQTDERVLKGYELGAVDFLFKPLQATVLRAKARVFVELFERTEEMKRQAEALRAHERSAAERRLAEERERWERETLERQMAEQREAAEAMAARAEELARTVAERSAAQRELKRTNARLAESDRRKDQFLATLAHELRNPLAPLAYAIGLLQDRDDPELTEVWQRIERQLGHLERLVDDLLDVSRVTSGKIELRRADFDLREVAQRAVELSRARLNARHHELSVSLPDEPVPMHGDAVRLAQVISNLLNNAARYTEPHGHVKLTVTGDGETAEVIVEDDGRGIEPRMLGTIFDAFVQERVGQGGLGLGLHLAKQLVEMHEGRIAAHSEGVGQGSTFRLELPIAEVEGDVSAPDVRRPDSSIELTPVRPLRVAVIEDQEDVREMVGLLLTRWGHVVEDAEDGERGVALLTGWRCDIALIDIGLPDMEGYEVAARVRAELGARCPTLIAVTGWGQESDRQRAMEAGFDRHLVKPVSPRDLKRVLIESSSGRRAVGVQDGDDVRDEEQAEQEEGDHQEGRRQEKRRPHRRGR